MRKSLQHFDDALIFSFSYKKLRRFFQADDGDTEDGHDEYKGPVCIPDVSPALVIVICASGLTGRTAGAEVREEGPGKETCDQLSNA